MREHITFLILPMRQSLCEPLGSHRNNIRKPLGTPLHMPQTIRRTERSTDVQICVSDASGTTVDRQGDGRICKGLKSLDGR